MSEFNFKGVMNKRTFFDKVWDRHVVKREAGFPDVLYIDQHFIHEGTNPQAFDGLQKRGLPVARPKVDLEISWYGWRIVPRSSLPSIHIRKRKSPVHELQSLIK
jgi:hypothetical protein